MQQSDDAGRVINRRQILASATAGGVLAAFGASRAEAAPSTERPTALAVVRSAVTAAPPVGDTAKDTASILAAVQAGKAAGKPARLQRGTYFVDSLHLPSGTDLDLNGAVLRQVHPTAGSDLGAAVRNADFTHGNERIAVYNGTITLGAGARGRIVAMENVKQLTLSRLTVSKGTGDFADWMLYVRHAQDVMIADCTVTGGTLLGEDGIHLEACRRVVVDGCTVSAGDDALAIVQQQRCPTVSADIHVSNCSFQSRAAYVIRCSVYPHEKHGIYNVWVSNCTGKLPATATGNAMLVNDDTGKGKIAHLSFSDVTISSATSRAGGAAIRGLRNSSFARVSVSGVGGRSIDVRTSRSVAFQGCTAKGRTRGGGEGWWVEDCTDIAFVGCTSTDSPVAGYTVTGERTARVSFTRCRATGAGTYGWVLSTSANLRFVGCATVKPRIGAVYDPHHRAAARTII